MKLLYYALAALLATSPVRAAPTGHFPNRPIHIIVGAAAGGITDLTARIVAGRISKTLGVPVLTVNQPGAGGSIAATAAAHSPPDGYTLLMGSISTHGANPSLYKNLAYDPVKDFEPISEVVSYPLVVVINPKKIPVRTLAELIQYAKDHPGKLNRGSAGVGTSMHLSGELFNSMAGVKINHVPYKGSAPAMADLLGGQIGLDFEALETALPYIRSGRLRALAVTSRKRNPLVPDVPAIDETLKGYDFSGWIGLLAPAGTPEAAITSLNTAIVAALRDPEVVAKLQSQGAVPEPGTPAQFSAFIKSQIAKLHNVIVSAGINAQ